MKKKEEIVSELKNISTIVSEAAVQQPFSVSDDYFETLSSQVLIRIADEKSSQIVPENYFDDLAPKIIQQIQTGHSGGRMISMISKMAIAAAFAGLIGFALVRYLNNKADNEFAQEKWSSAQSIISNRSFDEELNKLDEESLLYYLDATGHDVQSAMVASLTEENNLPDPEEYIFDESTLSNYLHQNNLDEISLINN